LLATALRSLAAQQGWNFVRDSLFREAIIVHLLSWWGVRVLPSQAAFVHIYAANSAGWWTVRLIRAVLGIGMVLAWARWRRVKLANIGFGHQ
jgi:hypothetical protein